jgi:hypothetical protein
MMVELWKDQDHSRAPRSLTGLVQVGADSVWSIFGLLVTAPSVVIVAIMMGIKLLEHNKK